MGSRLRGNDRLVLCRTHVKIGKGFDEDKPCTQLAQGLLID